MLRQPLKYFLVFAGLLDTLIYGPQILDEIFVAE
jgi:hypothetical protein